MHPLLHIWWGVVVLAAVGLVVSHERWATRSTPAPVLDDPETVEIPNDLVAFAMLQSETWAQDDLMKICRQRYAQFRDWNKVRVAMGVGTIG